MYSALDRCMMLDFLKCPSFPCHNDDTGRSANKSPLSLRVTYNGYKECTFGPGQEGGYRDEVSVGDGHHLKTTRDEKSKYNYQKLITDYRQIRVDTIVGRTGSI